MKVLITGGAGYIGSILVPELLRSGHHVHVLDSFMFDQTSLAGCCQSDRFQVTRGDARSERTLKPLLAQADLVIPLAARVGMPLCAADKTAATTTNVEAISMLCRLASAHQRIIIPTTNSGYGVGQKDRFCTEDSPLNPISLYGVTKVKAEKVVLERSNSLSLRLATVFGLSPRMRTDLLVNDFVYRAVHDRAVVIFEGQFKRNYIHVRDVARAFLHAIDHFDSMKGGPYNVGLEDANLSKIELCRKIQEHVPGFVYLEAPIGEDMDKRDYVVSNKKIMATGFTPQWGLERGIRELIKGYTMLRNTRYANV